MVKLSWPRANDRRRDQRAPTTARRMKMARISDARFVHTSHWDIELYHRVHSLTSGRELSLLDVPTLWNPCRLEALDGDLLAHFCCVASASLPTFGQDAIALGNFLVRVAFEGNTASSEAVFQALLAFSSLHRYGLQSQAIELKIEALGSLAEGFCAPSLDAKEAIEHIATGMLLCSFEIHQASCTSGQWTGYLAGVKTVINEISTKTLLQFDPDVAILLDWVHYQDVLARFSLLHWKREGAPPTPTDLFCSQISHIPRSPPIFSMLNLLSQVCDAVSSSAILPEISDSVDDYKGFLTRLDWRIRNLPIPEVTDHADDATLVIKLYQLAILLYLNRSSEGLIDQPIRTQQQIDQAFAIFPRLSSCKQQFPIFIIGCESRTDEQRAIILDVISRTEKMSSSRSFNHCKLLLHAVWAQDDLTQWNNFSYCAKLTTVLSYCAVVPTFV